MLAFLLSEVYFSVVSVKPKVPLTFYLVSNKDFLISGHYQHLNLILNSTLK